MKGARLVRRRSLVDQPFEEGTKRAESFEAHDEAYLGDLRWYSIAAAIRMSSACITVIVEEDDR